MGNSQHCVCSIHGEIVNHKEVIGQIVSCFTCQLVEIFNSMKDNEEDMATKCNSYNPWLDPESKKKKIGEISIWNMYIK